MPGVPMFFGRIDEMPPGELDDARRLVGAYKSLRHLLTEDFYPLTPRPRDAEEPDAVEFCGRDGRQAILMAWSFESPVAELRLKPRGLLPERQYELRQLLPHPMELGVQPAGQLADCGYVVSLPPRSAALLMLTAR
jgi:hypothetical protein